MNINKQLPTFSDFKNLVNTHNFSQEDIDFQSRKCVKVGFDSFDNYLLSLYDDMFRNFNFSGLIETIKKTLPTLDINVPGLVNTYKVPTVSSKNKLNPIYDKVKLFPEDIKGRLASFENKLFALLLKFTLDGLNLNPLQKELSKNVILDVQKQKALSIPSKDLLQSTEDYLDSFELINTKQFVDNLRQKVHYFPKHFHRLEKLHTGLVNLTYIEPNEDFLEIFKSQTKKPQLKTTVWLVDTPKLAYLLYRLNNKSQIYNEMGLEHIADTLFTFKVIKTKDNLRASFRNSYENFNNEDYLTKKMPSLKALLDEHLK